jgi:hypothetical protein
MGEYRRRSQPIAVAARSKARTVFSRSNAGIVGSNPTQGMDVCVPYTLLILIYIIVVVVVCIHSVYCVLCV